MYQILMKKSNDSVVKQKKDGTKQKNMTGIPTQMKMKFEGMSGLSFDDVRVHYNSDKPAQMQAFAYTQGNDVYVGPGQEKHLGHELGHVVQQKQGRVKPTEKINGEPVNTDARLEKEADQLGAASVQFKATLAQKEDALVQMKAPIQMDGFIGDPARWHIHLVNPPHLKDGRNRSEKVNIHVEDSEKRKRSIEDAYQYIREYAMKRIGANEKETSGLGPCIRWLQEQYGGYIKLRRSQPVNFHYSKDKARHYREAHRVNH